MPSTSPVIANPLPRGGVGCGLPDGGIGE